MLSVARWAASKMAVIRVCWLGSLMRLDCSQAQRHSTGIAGGSLLPQHAEFPPA